MTSNCTLTFDLYVVYQEMSSLFSVNPHSGWLTLLTSLDRETKAQYNLTVQVVDYPANSRRKNLFPALTVTTSVIVTVTDINDNPPTFK